MLVCGLSCFCPAHHQAVCESGCTQTDETRVCLPSPRCCLCRNAAPTASAPTGLRLYRHPADGCSADYHRPRKQKGSPCFDSAAVSAAGSLPLLLAAKAARVSTAVGG